MTVDENPLHECESLNSLNSYYVTSILTSGHTNSIRLNSLTHPIFSSQMRDTEMFTDSPFEMAFSFAL